MKQSEQKELTREIQQRIDLDDEHEDRFDSTKEETLFPESVIKLPEEYPRINVARTPCETSRRRQS